MKRRRMRRRRKGRKWRKGRKGRKVRKERKGRCREGQGATGGRHRYPIGLQKAGGCGRGRRAAQVGAHLDFCRGPVKVAH
jgi:hypothetical protein